MFHRIFAILLIARVLCYSQSAHLKIQESKAAIYTGKQVSSLKALLVTLAPSARISENHEGEVTNLTCEWPDAAVRLTVKSNWRGLSQGPSMKGWLLTLPSAETNSAALKLMFSKIDSTVDCIGCVTTPRYDSGGKACSLIVGLAAKLDGLIFCDNAFYDSKGQKILGVSEATARFAGKSE